jgi:hypothetical protein
VDRLRIDLSGYDLGVFSEELCNGFGSRVPGNLCQCRASGSFVRHFDYRPVHTFCKFTQILEGNRVFCVVDRNFPHPRRKPSSQTRRKRRIFGAGGHVTDQSAADNTSACPSRADATGHTLSAKSASQRTQRATYE